MIPQTRAGTPAWPGGGAAAAGLPETGLAGWPCGPKPPDRDRGAWYVADIDIDGARARGPEREKNKLARSTRMR
jgi:hypothetical protein